MEVSGQLHHPTALPPVKRSGTRLKGDCVGPTAGLHAVEYRKSLEDRNPAIKPAARRYTD
jgi:hypothetical protein